MHHRTGLSTIPTLVKTGSKIPRAGKEAKFRPFVDALVLCIEARATENCLDKLFRALADGGSECGTSRVSSSTNGSSSDIRCGSEGVGSHVVTPRSSPSLRQTGDRTTHSGPVSPPPFVDYESEPVRKYFVDDTAVSGAQASTKDDICIGKILHKGIMTSFFFGKNVM